MTIVSICWWDDLIYRQATEKSGQMGDENGLEGDSAQFCEYAKKASES